MVRTGTPYAGRSVTPLPSLMVAPNGARRTKANHPALPVTIAEIVETARACHGAGAGGIHAHVRDGEGAHVLDAGLYRELLAELHRVVPAMAVQITTEAVGRYTPAQQRALVDAVRPDMVSVALGEMLSDGDEAAARRFYHGAADAGIAVQHILYSADDVARFAAGSARGIVPAAMPQWLFVLGRYATNQQSAPADLDPFLAAMAVTGLDADWAVCAFGVGETACLAAAHHVGGKMRVGFENSLWNADGSIAADNAERVREIMLVTAAS